MILKVNKDICEIKQNEVWNVGDYNVHTVQVELSEEFDGLVNKVRYFVEDNSYDMLITDNIAQVPYEATVMEGTIKIGVYGYDADTDILVQSTSPVNKYISSGTYTGEADNTEPLTPTDKEQMQTAIQKNTNDITDLKENKQDKLISGVNIKTINNESILSGGNLTLVTEETDPIFTNSPAYSITDNDITYWNNKANMSDIPDVSNFITKDVDDLTYYTKSTDMQTSINNAVGDERTARENADNSLQNQIDAITVSSDVVDVVSTYQDLVDYDTQHIKANDIIKVMQDSTHDNAISYYRWVIVNHVGSWEYVGSEGPYYTKSETDTLLNDKQNTITTTNKLQSDLVDDTNQTNLFVTSEEKTSWSNKLDQSDLTNYVKNTDYASSSKGGVIKTGSNANVDNNGVIYADNQTYSDYSSSANTAFISKGTLENVITGKNLETANNKVTSISPSSTDVQYPSAKCVYDNDVIIKDDVNTKYDYLFSLTNLFGKITATGTNITLNNTAECPAKINLEATESEQITNLYNGTIEQGSINNLGELVNANDRIRTKDYIEVNPSTSINISFSGVTNYLCATYNSSKTFISTGSWQSSGTDFNVDSSTYYIKIIFKKDSEDITPSSISNLQVGNVPNPDYPQTIHTVTGDNEVNIVGKNLFNYNKETQVVNGVNFTINKDKSITANGTASSQIYWKLGELYFQKDDTYYISGSPSNGSASTYRVVGYLHDENGEYITSVLDTGNGTSFSGNKGYRLDYYIHIVNGVTVTDKVFKPMVSTLQTAYTPYQSQTYSINLGDIEICKIGDYQDVIFKNTMDSDYYDSSLVLNKWYLKKNVGKVVLDGSDGNWTLASSTSTYYEFQNYNALSIPAPSRYIFPLSTHFSNTTNNRVVANGYVLLIRVLASAGITTASDFINWLGTNNVSVFYELATPTYILLSNTLQTQLDNLQYALAYDTQTNISQTNTDLPFIINAETYVKIGGGGTSDYTNLTNKPKINNVELVGNKSLNELGIQPAGNYLTEETDPTVPNYVKNITQANITSWNNKSDFSGNYNDLTNKPTIPSEVTETTVSNWGFTKNIGTITGITMNGASKGTSGVVDLGTVITQHQDISGKANKISVVQTSASTIEINPNTFYKFGEVASLNITLASITDNTIYNEYMFEFVSGTTATTLTLPSSIKWLETPTIDANKIYQCSIVDNVGLLVGVTNV